MEVSIYHFEWQGNPYHDWQPSMCSLRRSVWWPDRVFAHHCSCVLCGLRCPNGWILSILLRCKSGPKQQSYSIRVELELLKLLDAWQQRIRDSMHFHLCALTSDKVHRWDLCNLLNRLMHCPTDISALCHCCIDLLDMMMATPTAPMPSCIWGGSYKLLKSAKMRKEKIHRVSRCLRRKFNWMTHETRWERRMNE